MARQSPVVYERDVVIDFLHEIIDTKIVPKLERMPGDGAVDTKALKTALDRILERVATFTQDEAYEAPFGAHELRRVKDELRGLHEWNNVPEIGQCLREAVDELERTRFTRDAGKHSGAESARRAAADTSRAVG